MYVRVHIMGCSLIFRLIWVAYVIAVSIAANVENTATSFNCPCRLIAECSDGILDSDSGNSTLTCESLDMIRCCAFPGDKDTSVNNTLFDILQNPSEEGMKHTLNDRLTNSSDYSVGQIEDLSSVTWELPPGILPPPVNFVYPEYSETSKAVDLKSIESNDSKKFDADILQDVQHTVAFMKTNRNLSLAADAVSDEQLDDAEMLKLIGMENFPEGIIPPATGFVYPEYIKSRNHPPFPEENAEYVQPKADSVDSDPYIPEQEIYPDENEEYSPYIQQLINEATSFESMRIYPKDQFVKRSLLNKTESRQSEVLNQLSKRDILNESNLNKSEADQSRLNLDGLSNVPGTAKALVTREIKLNSENNKISSSQPLEAIDDNTQLNVNVNSRAAMGKSSEFGESAIPANAQTTDRYENQSMVSSSPKDVPTMAVNSFEQKTSSETFLSLDRISTQPINKNTPTTNRSEATKNNGGVFTAARRNPSFTQNTEKIRDFVRNHINRVRNKPREKTNVRREFTRVENATKTTTSVPRRDNPLQVSTRDDRLTSSLTTPAMSQKDILNQKHGKTEYKNNTVEKEDTESSLQVNRFMLKTQADKNTRKDSVEVTTVTVPVKKLRFPPRVLPTRPTPHKKERNSTSIGSFGNSKRRFSDYFRRFYGTRKNVGLNINNNKLDSERMKSTTPASASKDPISVSTKKNDKAIEERTENTNAFNNTIDSKNHSSDMPSDLQNTMLTLEKITAPLNMSTPSRKVRKSMQTEAIQANNAVPPPLKNISDTPSEMIVQKIDENSEQLLKSEVNKDRTQKHFNVDSQSSRNKTQTARSSEPSSSSANTASDQVLDASDKIYSTADIASSSDTEKIIEASPRPAVIEVSPQPTIIVNRTETFDNIRNSPLSVTVISDKLDMSNKTDWNDLKTRQEEEDTNNSYTKEVATGLTEKTKKDGHDKIFSTYEMTLKRLDPVYDQFGMLHIMRQIFLNAAHSLNQNKNLAEGLVIIKEKLEREELKDIMAKSTKEKL